MASLVCVVLSSLGLLVSSIRSFILQPKQIIMPKVWSAWKEWEGCFKVIHEGEHEKYVYTGIVQLCRRILTGRILRCPRISEQGKLSSEQYLQKIIEGRHKRRYLLLGQAPPLDVFKDQRVIHLRRLRHPSVRLSHRLSEVHAPWPSVLARWSPVFSGKLSSDYPVSHAKHTNKGWFGSPCLLTRPSHSNPSRMFACY